MYKKKHIIINSEEKHSGKCGESCCDCEVLHFHIKKNAKEHKKDALMFFPKDGGEIKQVMDLHKSFYPNSEMMVSNGIDSFQFVPEYDTDDYKYYRGQGINSVINDARTHHYQTLDGNRFMHNIDRNTLFGPITDITTEATDLLFGKSEDNLTKAQTTISFPNHPEIESNQSQNVYPTNLSQGVTRRGQTYLDRKIGAAQRDVKENFGNGKTLKQATYNKYGKKDRKNIESTPDTGQFYPGKVHNFAVANPTGNEASIHHEANHRLTDKLVDKFGQKQVHNLYSQLVDKIDPKIKSVIDDSLASRDYKFPNKKSPLHEHLAHKEELINAVRDLTQKGDMRNKLNLTYDKSKPHDHDNNIESVKLDGRIKNSWKDIVDHAKNHKFKPIKKSELMQKSVKNAITAGVTGLALLQAGHNAQSQSKAPQQIERQQDIKVSRRPSFAMSQDGKFKTDPQAKSNLDNRKKDAFLNAIAMNESSGGKNMNYPPGGGMHGNDKAFSKYGIMPIVARESINRHPDLKEKYGHLLTIKDNNMLGQLLQKHGAGQDIAEHRYKYLSQKFNGSPHAMAHAWRRGVKGTNDALNAGKDIMATDYVKKFDKNYSNSL